MLTRIPEHRPSFPRPGLGPGPPAVEHARAVAEADRRDQRVTDRAARLWHEACYLEFLDGPRRALLTRGALHLRLSASNGFCDMQSVVKKKG